jgi:hypothetical protein
MKARLGMIEAALAKYPFMDVTHSFLAGDSAGDTGPAAGGGRSVMVCRVPCTPVRGLERVAIAYTALFRYRNGYETILSRSS